MRAFDSSIRRRRDVDRAPVLVDIVVILFAVLNLRHGCGRRPSLARVGVTTDARCRAQQLENFEKTRLEIGRVRACVLELQGSDARLYCRAAMIVVKASSSAALS